MHRNAARLRHLVATTAAGAAFLCTAIVGPVFAPATAFAVSACTLTSGTVVAVDFGHWGGPLVRGCGVNQPNGLALLDAAGFTTAGDHYDGPGFVCRIGDSAFAGGTQYPTPADDKCIVTPPSSAYWSYWVANRGSNSWAYAQTGPANESTLPGQVQAWTFGGGSKPSFTPNSVRPAPSVTPTHPATHTSRPTQPRTSTAPAATHSTTTTSTHSPKASATAIATGPAATSSGAPAPSVAGTSASQSIVAALPSTHTDGSGSATGVVIGAVIALALLAAGWLTRRRRAGQAGRAG